MFHFLDHWFVWAVQAQIFYALVMSSRASNLKDKFVSVPFSTVRSAHEPPTTENGGGPPVVPLIRLPLIRNGRLGSVRLTSVEVPSVAFNVYAANNTLVIPYSNYNQVTGDQSDAVQHYVRWELTPGYYTRTQLLAELNNIANYELADAPIEVFPKFSTTRTNDRDLLVLTWPGPDAGEGDDMDDNQYCSAVQSYVGGFTAFEMTPMFLILGHRFPQAWLKSWDVKGSATSTITLECSRVRPEGGMMVEGNNRIELGAPLNATVTLTPGLYTKVNVAALLQTALQTVNGALTAALDAVTGRLTIGSGATVSLDAPALTTEDSVLSMLGFPEGAAEAASLVGEFPVQLSSQPVVFRSIFMKFVSGASPDPIDRTEMFRISMANGALGAVVTRDSTHELFMRSDKLHSRAFSELVLTVTQSRAPMNVTHPNISGTAIMRYN